jgi:hypothetical protein
LYRSDVEPKYRAARISIAPESLLRSSNAGPRYATLTHGSVSLAHGT